MVFPSFNGGFFNHITSEYGLESTKLLKSWRNMRNRICISTQQRTFLVRCRRYDVLPPHIQYLRYTTHFFSRVAKRKFDNLKKRNQKTILNLEIRDINNHLKYLKSRIIKIEELLKSKLPINVVTDFFKFSNNKINAFNLSLKTKSIAKFDNIICKQNINLNPFYNINTDKWLVNLSNKQIPKFAQDILSLGERFCLPLDLQNKKDRLCSVVEMIKCFDVSS